MTADVSLDKLLKFSNLRARVKLNQRGLADTGGLGDHGLQTVAGGDVRLEDLEDISISSLTKHFADDLEHHPSRQANALAVQFENGSRHEEVDLMFERDGSVFVEFTLDGGNSRGLPYARRHADETFLSAGAVVRWLEHMPADEEVDEDYWRIGLTVTDDKVTVGRLCAAMKATRAALCTFRGELGPDRRVEFRQHLLDGRFGKVLGTAESAWLECKSDLLLGQREANKNLTREVCGLANGRQPSLLVIGLKTEPLEGRDVITDITPVPARVHTAERYRKIIDNHIQPVIAGLEIDILPADGGVLVVLSIPAQPEHTKPFVVTKDDSLVIYERRGDRTVALSAAEVRALLTAGWRK
ncbi:helix-turn-helix domain-containing protein [Amycolatopsis sp. cmx-4-83]|uniref:AlbA family DNA-binding domain-containing protein n=1 Tax=Amycolatopsis sp. cmx-4-83 TaxID=2790940 RepID=UPI00397DFF13